MCFAAKCPHYHLHVELLHDLGEIKKICLVGDLGSRSCSVVYFLVH